MIAILCLERIGEGYARFQIKEQIKDRENAMISSKDVYATLIYLFTSIFIFLAFYGAPVMSDS